MDPAEVLVGKRLRIIRERSRLAQTEFALIIGIGRERLASYETGQVPLPPPIGEKICDQWNVNPFWLANGEGPQVQRHIFRLTHEMRETRRSFRDVMRLVLTSAAGASPTEVAVSPAEKLFRDESTEPDDLFDKSVRRLTVPARERDVNALDACVKKYGPVCQACGVKFEDLYGKIGRGFIEIHCQEELAETKTKQADDLYADMVPLCSNCHSVIHLQSPPLTVPELKEIIARRRRR